jgi:hypothetical protein
LIRASETNELSVTLVSPACTGSTPGAGSAEHGCTVIVPPPLGGLLGQSCCVAERVSPAENGGFSETRCSYPHDGNENCTIPFRLRVMTAPLTTFVTVTCWPPA